MTERTSAKQYVSAVTCRACPITTPGIIIALYGPRGGTVCVAELSHIEAAMLRDQLTAAVAKLIS